MFNIGTPELLLVLVIAMVVVGPERLPDLARWVGRGLRELRKVQDDVKDMVQTGMGDEFRDAANEVKGAVTEMRKSASEMKRAAGITAAASGPHVARPLTPVAGDTGSAGDDRSDPEPAPTRDGPAEDPVVETPVTEPPVTEPPVQDAPAAEAEPGASAAE
jgi:Tat protein translocase TatB subunit